jgi:uncharacterized protein GlcG (DUF336 family)
MDQTPPNLTPGQIPNRRLFECTEGRPITPQAAKQFVLAAEHAAYARGLRMCLTVLDFAGHLVAFHRMDGALLMFISAF